MALKAEAKAVLKIKLINNNLAHDLSVWRKGVVHFQLEQRALKEPDSFSRDLGGNSCRIGRSKYKDFKGD